jgi:hypothetical protein
MRSRTPGVEFALFIAVLTCGLAIGCSEAASEATESTKGGGSVVARIGDHVITDQELDAEVKVKNAKAYQAFYDARRAALEELIRKQVLSTEAAARGVSEQELFDEATRDVQPPTDAEVESFYNSNTSRMGGRTLEQMAPQIRTYLENTARQAAGNEIIDQLKKKYGVSLLLEPPRMEVQIAANDPSYGPEDAPIVMVEFSDFQ